MIGVLLWTHLSSANLVEVIKSLAMFTTKERNNLRSSRPLSSRLRNGLRISLFHALRCRYFDESDVSCSNLRKTCAILWMSQPLQQISYEEDPRRRIGFVDITRRGCTRKNPSTFCCNVLEKISHLLSVFCALVSP